MSEDTPLDRAHALSAHASILLGPGQVTAQTLSLALKAYQDAADLFEQASQEVEDASAKRTLQLLVTQHRKLARDLERKLHSAPGLAAGGSGTQNGVVLVQATRESVRRSYTTPAPHHGRDAVLGLGAIGRDAWPPPGIATRLSPSRGLGAPPFAMRPPIDPQTQPEHQALSPLHSSSSSSGTGTETGGSYINFGAVPDTLDPFSRFWGKLDNMLDDISNPVAFATAPMDSPGAVRGENEIEGARRERKRTGEKKKDKEKADSGSFYLVNKHSLPKQWEGESSSGTPSPTEKTPEELVLENENLRISLDAIASHAQTVDNENKRLRQEAEERSRLMKSVVLEVRKEAQKAKYGQDLMRSQLLGSIPAPSPRTARLEGSRYPVPPSTGNGELISNQRKRIESLEEELRLLKEENEKNKEAALKYKERIDKIKANAKSKKEAKLRGEDGKV